MTILYMLEIWFVTWFAKNRIREYSQIFANDACFFSVTFWGPAHKSEETKLLLLPDRPRRFMEAMNQIDSPFKAQRYAERMAITQRTAQKDLQILVAKGLLVKVGMGKNTRYMFK